MHRIELSGAAHRDLKKLPEFVQNHVAIQLDRLGQDPYQGERLHGVLQGIWKHAFPVRGTEYRIAYQVLSDPKLVLIIMIGSRENFYERLSRRHR